MPITTIPIIARTNTIDEWRIQTNKSASDLNDLGFGTYDKDQGTLILSNTSVLQITAEGTPLQVANNVLFQNNLTLSNNLILGVQSSGTGNIVAGGAFSVRGPGRALSVSNNAYVGVNLEVVSSIYTGNVYANNDVTIGDDLTVDGVLTLPGTGTVLDIDDGEASINLLTGLTVSSANVRTDNLYAAFARVDVLDDLAFARIGILENVTGNSYYLSSNSHTSNSISTRYLTANISGNIVNFTSDIAAINTATILNGNTVTFVSNSSSINVLFGNTATIATSANIVNLTTNVSAINTASIGTATVITGNVVNLTTNVSAINTASIGTATVITGNVVTLNSNLSFINTATIGRLTTTNTDIETLNVSSSINVQTGVVRISSATNTDDALIVDLGDTRIRDTVIDGNLTVTGTYTQSGNINFEVDTFILNANSNINKNGTFINYRPEGDDAIIKWNETDDWWEISSGNTYAQLNKILDRSEIHDGVFNTSSLLVASANAVNIAYTAQTLTGRYANSAYAHSNSAYLHANASYTSQNSTGAYANSAYAHANSGYIHANSSFETANANTARLTTNNIITASYANSAYLHANSAHRSQNTTGVYANAAFALANTALIAGGQIAGGYANSAYETANTAVVNAELAEAKAIEANTTAQAAFDQANTALIAGGQIAGSYANSGYIHANSAYDAANTKLDRITGGTVQASLVVQGRFTAANLSFDNNNAALLPGSKFVFNSNQNQNQGPSLNAVIEVDRGTDANAQLRYNETIDKWEYSHDGTNYGTLGFNADRANNLTGGATNRIPFQSAENTTSYIIAPIASNRYLQWNGTNFDWSAIPLPDLSSATFRADQITSGTFDSSRLSGTYNINITGSAGSATTATTATTASSATNATNATNVTSGGTVNTNSITNFGVHLNYSQGRFISGGTTTSKSDPSNLAALKVVGDIACSNDVWSTFFRGTATAALYADLAEKYLSDKKYSVGTIMMVGGKKEVTAAKNNKKHAVIGIVSEKPAYIMNSDLKNGLMVGLKGRLPVRLIGTCEKGDLITISEKSGVGISAKDNVILPFRIIALENKETEEEGLIEVVIM
jgi:hypothetical protein